MGFQDLFKKIQVIDEFDVVEETIDIINRNRSVLIRYLKDQLSRGKDGKEQNVTIFGKDFYSDATIQDKKYNGIGLGKETEFITNYMSGNFYSSIKLVVIGYTFELTSDLPYFEEIIRRSGSVIMEIDKYHLEKFSREILLPELQRRFSERFNS